MVEEGAAKAGRVGIPTQQARVVERQPWAEGPAFERGPERLVVRGCQRFKQVVRVKRSRREGFEIAAEIQRALATTRPLSARGEVRERRGAGERQYDQHGGERGRENAAKIETHPTVIGRNGARLGGTRRGRGAASAPAVEAARYAPRGARNSARALAEVMRSTSSIVHPRRSASRLATRRISARSFPLSDRGPGAGY